MSTGCTGTEADDLTSASYEELVKDIYEVLGRADCVTIECWGRNCEIEGPPGVFSQIDVLTRHTAGLHEYRTAIECKYWNRRVPPGVVRTLAQIVQDAGLSKGVVVSKLGFSDQAQALAEAHNIGLVELRKPLDRDWEGYIRAFHVIATVDLPPTLRMCLHMARPEELAASGGVQNRVSAAPVGLERAFVSFPGQGATSLADLIDAETGQRADEETIELEFANGSVLTIPDYPEHPWHGQVIKGVSISVEQREPMTEEFTIRTDEHVYMVMESLFDSRRFTIGKDGTMTENAR